jgi:hypothetical protein
MALFPAGSFFAGTARELLAFGCTDRDVDLLGSARCSVVWSSRRTHSVHMEGTGKRMNTYQVDYSFAYGMASAVIGICVILTAWYAAKAWRKTHHGAQIGRRWRKQ